MSRDGQRPPSLFIDQNDVRLRKGKGKNSCNDKLYLSWENVTLAVEKKSAPCVFITWVIRGTGCWGGLGNRGGHLAMDISGIGTKKLIESRRLI